MNEFKTILIKLKEMIRQQVQSDKKVMDRQVAETLGIRPTTFASYKSKDKPPYRAILTYCHDNRLDVRKVLFDEDEPIVNYPIPVPIETGKVQVKYFKTLEVYAIYLDWLNESSLLHA